jgi:hypothetical protein
MLAAGAATVAMGAVSAPAEALTVYTDRTAWQTAISGLTNLPPQSPLQPYCPA